MADAVLSLTEAEDLVVAALAANRTSETNARSTARALVRAEADGHVGHGLVRVPSYAAQARVGKIDGFAIAEIEPSRIGALRVDAAFGFAYPAIDLAIESLLDLTPRTGVAAAAIRRSHHLGQAGAHAERLAERGLIGLVFSNSPQAMAFHGGARPRLGTNPIAFACPAPGPAPLVIDMALSQAARARIVAARKSGAAIPEGWAIDAEGRPTTDPEAALGGAMLAMGGAKGAGLALMVEILAAALSGGSYGWEASSFLDDKGAPPSIGHLLITVDPEAFAQGFTGRIAALLETMAEEADVRPPGVRRLDARSRARKDGLVVPSALFAEITALAA